VKNSGAIDKPTRVKDIRRDRLVFAVEIKHPMLTRESISKRQFAELLTSKFRIEFVVIAVHLIS
jgi:hypothetical protein